ncbi:hypothetical protein GGR51DRAFT_156577 [Nemania sp. FL0031]|nr:hypothetical protein GGR51DRAFT_156577 [Nemania sp. FL0031]
MYLELFCCHKIRSRLPSTTSPLSQQQTHAYPDIHAYIHTCIHTKTPKSNHTSRLKVQQKHASYVAMTTPPPVPQLLGSENIKHWMRMVRCYASLHGLIGHLDGTVIVLEPSLGNDTHRQYEMDRMCVISLITNNVEPVACGLVVDHPNFFKEEDPHKLWNIIVERFPVPKCQRPHTLGANYTGMASLFAWYERWHKRLEVCDTRKPVLTGTVPEMFRKLLDLTTDTAPSRIGRPISDYMIEFNRLTNQLSEHSVRIAPELKTIMVLRAGGLVDHLDINDITWEEAHNLIMEMARFEVEGDCITMCHGLPDTEGDV